MNVYLDTSALNRIFDDQSQPRIFLEAASMLLIFGLMEKGIISVVSSDILLHENSCNPYPERRIFMSAVLQKAPLFQTLNDPVIKSALKVETFGIKGLDALHLACAEKLKVDYFVTCDDRIIQQYAGKVVVINPVIFTICILQQEVNNAGS